jgi:(E)-4-hydroxy-3-methylbut-2-enyl-diphosphate synthase
VRFTTQGKKEVEALGKIVSSLAPPYDQVPVAADVHFRADVACEAARVCHKVRINPGNFTERKSGPATFSDQAYEEALGKNSEQLRHLVSICREHHTALRIGVNHGSLSSRIMSRYGDTPEGMVESAMEFLRICNQEDFHDVVVSLKSSNTVLMVQAVRLLVRSMTREGLYYPVHLGVTESGDGTEGRIKSVVGMAPLLMEGIGDTLRVSLTEAPENEIPVAQLITQLFPKPATLPYNPLKDLPWDPFHHSRQETLEVHGVGGDAPVAVIAAPGAHTDPFPDLIDNEINNHPSFMPVNTGTDPKQFGHPGTPKVLVLEGKEKEMTTVKAWLINYYRAGGTLPVIFRKTYHEPGREKYLLKASGEIALLLIDRLIQGIWLDNPHFTPEYNNRLSFHVLQAARNRITATEYIACPSCGRTLFDIQSVLGEVRNRTHHLKGLKIAVMGCIVNGPGEMADADYGYIGAGRGMVNIYKGKTAVLKNVPEKTAVDRLAEVIREHGDWVNP